MGANFVIRMAILCNFTLADSDTTDSVTGQVIFWTLNTTAKTPIAVATGVETYDFTDSGVVGGDAVTWSVANQFTKGVGDRPAMRAL